MRTLRLAPVVSRVTLEQSKIFAWTRVVAIVVATTTMVLGSVVCGGGAQPRLIGPC